MVVWTAKVARTRTHERTQQPAHAHAHSPRRCGSGRQRQQTATVQTTRPLPHGGLDSSDHLMAFTRPPGTLPLLPSKMCARTGAGLCVGGITTALPGQFRWDQRRGAAFADKSGLARPPVINYLAFHQCLHECDSFSRPSPYISPLRSIAWSRELRSGCSGKFMSGLRLVMLRCRWARRPEG